MTNNDSPETLQPSGSKRARHPWIGAIRKMKMPIIAFVSGIIFTIMVYGVVNIFKYPVKSESNASDTLFGVEVKYGDDARQSAHMAGVHIPENATDCYYCIEGLKPVIEFVAFSVPRNKLWNSVKAATGINKNKFYPKGKGDFILEPLKPELFGKKYKTILYDLSSPDLLSAGFTIWGSVPARCFVNQTQNRIFIQITSDD